MELKFPHSVMANDPAKAGELACRPAKKFLFGDRSRYAAAPLHSQGGGVVWVLWDAEHPDSTISRAELIRETSSFEELINGLLPRTVCQI